MAPLRGSRRPASIALAIAAVFLAAHLPYLSPSLEDIDSINFALGLHDFDVAGHQPHPPGYPVYIALGRLSRGIVGAVAPGLAPVPADAAALAVLSALSGAAALVAAWALFSGLTIVALRRPRDGPNELAGDPGAVSPAPGAPHAGVAGSPVVATLLLATAPLFWMTALRPMSDMPGLAAALAAQAVLVRGLVSARVVVAGAMAAGLAAGLRSQTVWLTIPLLAAVCWVHRGRGIRWLMTRPAAALAAGGLAWAIPLLAASGGVGGYLRALGTQAGEDFAWVDMLWANPTPRRLAFATYETFVLPWASIPLAALVGVTALAGALLLFARARPSLVVLGVAFGPYVLFHLLFQETFHVRYALPVVPAVACLAGQAIAALGRAAPVGAAALAGLALFVAVPAGVSYGREPHPAFRAIAEMERAAAGGRPAAVHAHYSLRRPLQAAAPDGLAVVEPRRSFEWLGMVEYWRSGGRDPLWFLADPLRTDLALIDPQSRRNVSSYRWSVAHRPELSGARPRGVDWYRIEPPGWFAAEGWSLTPETGGIARASGRGIDRRPISAYIRRRLEPMYLLIGGRNLGPPDSLPALFSLSMDGRTVETWTLTPSVDGANFLRVIELPAGIPSGPGAYAHLTVAARAESPDVAAPNVAIRQFDVQPATGLTYGFGQGWHEEEYDNATGVRWRWTSDRSVLRIVPPQAVRLTLRGESPLRYFDAAPTVRVTAQGRVIGELRPEADFDWTVTVPADAVENASGEIAIETDRIYHPGEEEGTSDARRLGLRVYETRVYPVRP